MNFYIRNFRFKKSFFRKKTYILFEFYLGDKWRKGKMLFECSNPNSSISYVSSLILTYITKFLASKDSTWTSSEVKLMSNLVEQFGRDTIKDSTKLFK